jgi:hypothetical protein
VAKAKFTFYLDTQEVETLIATLVDTPGARAWAYAVLLNQQLRSVIPYNTAYPVIKDAVKMLKAYNNVCDCIHSIQDTEIAYQDRIPTLEEVGQPWLNRIHRHFTISCQRLWADNYQDYKKQYRLDPILQKLNLQIHQLERYVSTVNKEVWNTPTAQELHIKSDEISFDIKPFHNCHTFDYADIVLDAHILGKNLIESFLCDDQPIHWDTSGHVRTAGGCNFLLSDYRQRIYNSPEFADWLKRNDTSRENVFANFPIGNWLAGEKNKLNNMLAKLENNVYNTKCKIDILL